MCDPFTHAENAIAVQKGKDDLDVYKRQAMILLSLPAVFGFNILSGIQPLGAGTNIMDLEDFIVSNNILPLGSVVFVMFLSLIHI